MVQADITAVDRVRELLAGTTLRAINYVDVAMHRKPGTEPTGQGLTFPSETSFQYTLTPEAIIYRIETVVDRPDLVAQVAAVIMYAVTDMSPFADEEVVRTFGERVALPAAYPFIRSKLFDVTADCGAPAVLLNLVDLATANFKSTEVPQ